MHCVPSEDSDQPSLIRVFAVCMKRACVLGYPLSTQRRLWSDWADAQADLSLRWAYSHFVGFVMSRHKLHNLTVNIRSQNSMKLKISIISENNLYNSVSKDLRLGMTTKFPTRGKVSWEWMPYMHSNAFVKENHAQWCTGKNIYKTTLSECFI